MAIIFFDFDRTLVSSNTANLWLKSMWRQGKLRPFQALAALAWLICYNMGLVPLESGLVRALSFLEGLSEEDFIREVENFYQNEVAGIYRKDAIKAVEDHKKKGDKVVLLTSSIHHLSDLVVKNLKLDHGISTVLEIDPDGKYTGKCVGSLCFGTGKVSAAAKYAVEHGFTLSQCTFYSDSMSDLPMMEAVGNPIAVSPDPRLKRRAEQNGWPVVFWN